MNTKESIEDILYKLKKLKIGRREVEKDLDYSTFYLDQILAKGGNNRVLKALEKYLIEKSNKSSIGKSKEETHNPPTSIDILIDVVRRDSITHDKNADNMKMLAETIRDQSKVITEYITKESTDDFPLDMPRETAAKMKPLLLEIVKSAPKWKTEDEALEGVDKIYLSHFVKAKQKGKNVLVGK